MSGSWTQRAHRNVNFYSLDDGTTWIDLYSLPEQFEIPNVKTIKFKVDTADTWYYGWIQSEKLGFFIARHAYDNNYVSENYTLTENISDLELGVYEE